MFKTHQFDKRSFICADRQGSSASLDDRHANQRRHFITGSRADNWVREKGRDCF